MASTKKAYSPEETFNPDVRVRFDALSERYYHALNALKGCESDQGVRKMQRACDGAMQI